MKRKPTYKIGDIVTPKDPSDKYYGKNLEVTDVLKDFVFVQYRAGFLLGMFIKRTNLLYGKTEIKYGTR
jgi:hypothetical protein